jgi:phage virion morphogenesis protein
MTNLLDALEYWAAALLGQLEQAPRNKLVRSIGQTLRRSQQRRIVAQRNPDGSKYAPRKPRDLRSKHGKIKRQKKMFRKIHRSSLMITHASYSEISIGFTDRVAVIARIHQYGLKGWTYKKTTQARYKKREILGFRPEDLNLIHSCLLDHFYEQAKK